MRLAFFSPLPPARSGIADYSAALLDPLGKLVDVEVFQEAPEKFDAARFDSLLYQLGNNSDHEFAYRTALRHPGVTVMHDASLHHLLAEMTIRKGDWDAYLEELDYDSGAGALAYGQRVRRLEVGPDYEGVPMLRRILGRSKALIVHSRFVEGRMREAGFQGPMARIPHGAWVVEGDRLGYRQRIGLDHRTPLAGIFGHLKPYKRIAEALRAFRRVVRLMPQAKMILVGEPHPDFPVTSLIATLGLQPNVRVLGFTPLEDFVGYLSACDVVLNLRYPTVGESSGTMMRALGLGKAVVVSAVGSFGEFPDDVCLKAPVDASEEDFLFEYLNMLMARPDLAGELGARARKWVAEECSWEKVAARYAEFLRNPSGERAAEPLAEPTAQPGAAPEAPLMESYDRPGAPPAPLVEAEYPLGWARAEPARAYLDIHLTRLQKTLEITPPGGPADRILEMGAYLQITPALKTRLGYGEVRGCYYGPAGEVDHRAVTSTEGERFECEVDLFDAERDPFPYPDGHFATVLCCELIEHLANDPMFLMAEVNRILRPGGHLVLTTPNIGSARAIAAILQGYHPGFFPAYIRPPKSGEESEARHNREYTPKEITLLVADAGFEVVRLETGPFRDQPKPELAWVTHLLEQYLLSPDLRGDGIYALGRKTGPVRKRYPAWLYCGGE